MKKLATFVFALLLVGSLSFAQTGGSTAGAPAKEETGKKPANKTKTKAHKGGKKGHKAGKKGAETTPAAATPK